MNMGNYYLWPANPRSNLVEIRQHMSVWSKPKIQEQSRQKIFTQNEKIKIQKTKIRQKGNYHFRQKEIEHSKRRRVY